MGTEIFTRTTVEAKGEGLDPVNHVKAPSNLLLTVSRRYFCYVSTMLHVAMSVCVWSPAVRSPE